MAVNNKKWWTLSRTESYGLIAILALIVAGAVVLYFVRTAPAGPLPKAQCDKARAFVAALDTVSIDYEKDDRPHKSKRSHGEKRRQHSNSKGSTPKPPARGGGSDLRPMDRIDN